MISTSCSCCEESEGDLVATQILLEHYQLQQMINGIAFVGGVGGIEAEAGCLDSLHFRTWSNPVWLKVTLPSGTTATDVALKVTQDYVKKVF